MIKPERKENSKSKKINHEIYEKIKRGIDVKAK